MRGLHARRAVRFLGGMQKVLFALALVVLAVGCKGERARTPPARPVAPTEAAPVRDVAATDAADAGAANTPHPPDSAVHEQRK